jgi:hypothetical protein
MRTSAKLERTRLDAGLCKQCGAPANGPRCEYHKRQDTLGARRRRAKVKAPTKRCPLCLDLGHMYTTCPLNADATIATTKTPATIEE